MSKVLTFEYEGKPYTLEFTRETVKQLERQGLVADEIASKPNLYIPELFAGAFLAHHRFTAKRKLIDEIYSHMTNKAELIAKLIEMYRQPLAELLGTDDDADDGAEGNVTWTGNWE